ncbi:MAG TPA: Ku protein [Devosia sp.]|nr:Ku protein [Devosia sp.]
MMPRANWKGVLKVAEVTCPVSLYTAASTSERIAFHILNRKTGNRVHREYVDEETGKPVEAADQVKGYETGAGDYIVLEPEEIAEAVPESDKTLDVEAFIGLEEVDDTYFDRPYYLAPSTPAAQEAFALLREGMRQQKVGAVARTVLFRRLRPVMITAHDSGLVATTLNFDYEVRSAAEAFRDIPDLKIEGEMLDLARHIISTKAGTFEPEKFDDRYEAALAELVRAKIEGRKIPAKPKPAPATKPNQLLEALRQSAGGMRKAG